MKVGQFIKWLQTQDQNLEVCVVEKYEEEEYDWVDGREGEVYNSCRILTKVDAVCFDDPQVQSSKTQHTLTLGVAE